MSVDTMTRFFAILSLVTWAAVAVVVVLLVVERVRVNSRHSGIALLDEVRGNALWFGWTVATVATSGSLYLSEVAHFVPCPLCWYQRIALYPMVVILLVAAIRRDRSVRRYVIVQLAVGAAIAAYHTQLQAFPSAGSPFCTTTEPCTTRYVWEFGFVSIPFMALAAFVFTGTMVCLATHQPTARTETPGAT